jgi:hypothetical protein
MVSPVGADSHNRPTCRSCGHTDLLQVLNLGCVPLANALPTNEQLREREDRFPLELYFCPQSALVQIGESMAPGRLFLSLWRLRSKAANAPSVNSYNRVRPATSSE